MNRPDSRSVRISLVLGFLVAFATIWVLLVRNYKSFENSDSAISSLTRLFTGDVREAYRNKPADPVPEAPVPEDPVPEAAGHEEIPPLPAPNDAAQQEPAPQVLFIEDAAKKRVPSSTQSAPPVKTERSQSQTSPFSVTSSPAGRVATDSAPRSTKDPAPQLSPAPKTESLNAESPKAVSLKASRLQPSEMKSNVGQSDTFYTDDARTKQLPDTSKSAEKSEAETIATPDQLQQSFAGLEMEIPGLQEKLAGLNRKKPSSQEPRIQSDISAKRPAKATVRLFSVEDKQPSDPQDERDRNPNWFRRLDELKEKSREIPLKKRDPINDEIERLTMERVKWVLDYHPEWVLKHRKKDHRGELVYEDLFWIEYEHELAAQFRQKKINFRDLADLRVRVHSHNYTKLCEASIEYMKAIRREDRMDYDRIPTP